MPKIAVQIYSDIHLEWCKKIPKIKPLCDYLILAGDIGKINNNQLSNFLDHCSKNWEKTFYVLGNHEYYIVNSNFTKINEMYKNKITDQFTNVYYLDDQIIPINDEINLYGSTLWTPSVNDNRLNDYNYIDRQVVNAISKIQKQKLVEYLNKTNKKTIIVTHFPPTQNNTSDPIYKNQPQDIKNYFAHKNILNEVKTYNILCWISGHTHYSYDFKENGVRCISNQFGYTDELISGVTKLNIDGLYEFEY